MWNEFCIQRRLGGCHFPHVSEFAAGKHLSPGPLPALPALARDFPQAAEGIFSSEGFTAACQPWEGSVQLESEKVDCSLQG